MLKILEMIKQYLSSLKNSDLALQGLVDYYANSDEPTLIVQFGDHQPRLSDGFYSKLYGKSTNDLTLEEIQKNI